MDNLKIRFRFEDISFIDISELSDCDQKSTKNFFLNWEKKVRHSSIIQFLNKELGLDSTKVVMVSVEQKRESATNG